MKDNSYIFDNMDILSIRLFLRVAELGAISSAARDLSLSPASASARLAKLEESTGFRLFNRTTRAVSLTTDGAAFLPYAKQIVETLEVGLNINSTEKTQPKGLLRMAMPSSFARMHVIPLLAQFKKSYPQVTLDLRLSDEIVDAVESAYDIVIRNANLSDSSMIARKLATDQRILVASPHYIEQYGAPKKPNDLLKHQCVNFMGSNRWKFSNGETITTANTLAVNDGEAMRLLIESGMGIGIKSMWNAQQSLTSGKLIEVLADYPLITESSLWVLYPSNRIIAPKVRAMIDFLLTQFQPVPPWQK